MNRCFASAILIACAAFAGTGFAQNEKSAPPPVAPGSEQAQSPSAAPGAPHGQSPSTAPDSAQSQPGSAQSQNDAGSTVSVTGCLTKGTETGMYVITDQKTGEKYPFSGPMQLDKFVNQRVKLSGSMTAQGADKAFRPDRIAPVATTCEKAQ